MKKTICLVICVLMRFPPLTRDSVPFLSQVSFSTSIESGMLSSAWISGRYQSS